MANDRMTSVVANGSASLLGSQNVVMCMIPHLKDHTRCRMLVLFQPHSPVADRGGKCPHCGSWIMVQVGLRAEEKTEIRPSDQVLFRVPNVGASSGALDAAGDTIRWSGTLPSPKPQCTERRCRALDVPDRGVRVRALFRGDLPLLPWTPCGGSHADYAVSVRRVRDGALVLCGVQAADSGATFTGVSSTEETGPQREPRHQARGARAHHDSRKHPRQRWHGHRHQR
jgi:DNA-directed RNA polymerase subunit RPC12/RpoP